MAYSYLIKIDKDLNLEKNEIFKYIMDQINQDDMLDKINEIKCMSSKDLTNICRKKLLDLGKNTKQKQSCIELCSICNNCYEPKQFIFSFNACKHKYHKICINNFLKSVSTNSIICPICKDSYLPNIINIL
jgi:hypothetical protein